MFDDCCNKTEIFCVKSNVEVIFIFPHYPFIGLISSNAINSR